MTRDQHLADCRRDAERLCLKLSGPDLVELIAEYMVTSAELMQSLDLKNQEARELREKSTGL